jgi:hypothetical protein
MHWPRALGTLPINCPSVSQCFADTDLHSFPDTRLIEQRIIFSNTGLTRCRSLGACWCRRRTAMILLYQRMNPFLLCHAFGCFLFLSSSNCRIHHFSARYINNHAAICEQWSANHRCKVCRGSRENHCYYYCVSENFGAVGSHNFPFQSSGRTCRSHGLKSPLIIF